MPRIHARFYAPPLWERHAGGGSLAGEQIADLDKRHFLAWRPRGLCLLVLLQASLDDEDAFPNREAEQPQFAKSGFMRRPQAVRWGTIQIEVSSQIS